MTHIRLPVSLIAEADFLRDGPRSFRLLNRRTGTHFSLEAPERYMVGLLGKYDSPADIAREYEAKFGVPLLEETIWEFVGQLQRLELLNLASIPAVPRTSLTGNPSSTDARNGIESSNKVASLRLPAGTACVESSASPTGECTVPTPIAPLEIDPAETARVNTAFDILVMLFGWILHPIWLVPMVPIVIIAICILVRHWNQLGEESTIFWVRYPFVELFLASYVQTQFLMNLPLAILTGMCCRLNRGRIRTFGISYGKWVLPTASFSIDIGDAFVLMDSRGRRMHIAIRLLTPLILGAIYTIAWKAGSRASHMYLFWMCMVMTSIVFFTYQINPFSPYSSTHAALSWYLDDWKLHERAMDETWAWLCGIRSPEPLGWRERVKLRTYGTIAFLIRFSTDVALSVMAVYYLTRWFGSVGFATFLLLAGWWNREHLRPIWDWSGSSPQELHRQFTSLLHRSSMAIHSNASTSDTPHTHNQSFT
ncbi:hypothetical protein [Schlesneria paludicola]|uniref:hypothetical protein n=1 Tax=Schlesneria paludicola TaxID=360056 RepID=UPI00029AC58B|nr:hypothetical protein [Schlesneria paludicola]